MFGLTAIECFVAIIVVYAVLYWITPHKGEWFPFIIVVLMLSWLAFQIEPNETDDLSRYFTQLNYLRDYGYDYLKNSMKTNDNGSNWGTYKTCAYYFYYLSRFSDNHWMPAVTIFITYGLMFLVIYKASRKFNVEKPYLFLATMFFLSTYWYYDTYSGVRNGIAFAVIFACAYYHLVERKWIPLCYVGYVLACLMHSAGIMMVALVILAEITLNNSGKFINFLLVFGLIFGAALMQYLATKTDNNFIQTIAGQAEMHKSGEIASIDTMFFVNISILVMAFLIFMYYSIYILNCSFARDIKRIYKYSLIIMYFMIGCLFSGLIFVRFARWVLPIIGALFIMIGKQAQKECLNKVDNRYWILFAPKNETIRYKLRTINTILLVGYTGVHLWYLCNGSSLVWIHF